MTLKRRNAPKAVRRRGPSVANLNKKVALFKRERDEALEQLSAASEVLKVVSSSPGELEPVFQAILENATRTCEAKFGVLLHFDGETFRFAAEVGTPPAFAELVRQRGPFRPLVLTSPLIFNQRSQIADLALKARLPTINGFNLYPKVGGLMAYGPNFPSMFKRAGSYVDRILSGANPGATRPLRTFVTH